MTTIYSPRSSRKATIANGGTTSGAIDLTDSALLGFIMPAGWTAGTLTLQVSLDGSNWASPYDAYGSAVGSIDSPVASAAYAVDVTSLLAWRYVRFVSSVAQGAERVITCSMRALA